MALLAATHMLGLCRAAQQAELRPKAAEAQTLRDSVLALTQELDRVAAKRQALEAAQERARASALQSLTAHGQVSCPPSVNVG